jgi:hypothetical protein
MSEPLTVEQYFRPCPTCGAWAKFSDAARVAPSDGLREAAHCDDHIVYQGACWKCLERVALATTGQPCKEHAAQGFTYTVIGCPRCYPALATTGQPEPDGDVR